MDVVLPALLDRGVLVALLIVSIVGGPLLYTLQSVLLQWLRARRVRRIFEQQGIKCMPCPFVVGNMLEYAAIMRKACAEPMPTITHAFAPRVLPDLFQWSEIYGDRFVHWFGFQARYILRDPEQGKEVLTTKSEYFRKIAGKSGVTELLGDGLITLNGEKWFQHRRIVNPAFFHHKLKGMASIMGELTVKVIEKWGSDVKARRAIDVNGEFRELSADIIAHTAFGSSFEEGKAIFELQQKQQELLSKILSRFNVPGSKYLPTSENEYRKKLKKTINEGLSQIVKKRIGLTEVANGDRNDNDLLGLMLAANSEVLDEREKILRMGLDELIEECKTFFFAGHETTATLLTFMFLLLGTHLEWQERLRDEVYEACGKAQLPTVDSLNYLKLVGMVMNETLRLYPPAVMLRREATTDIKLGDTLIPAGTVVGLPILAWHQDEQYWGVDAKDFHPERFEEGIAKACKVPGAYLPFSLGPRNCIGQQFAYIEAKMVVATILQRYRFRLSPEYVHSPITVLTLRPQFGVPIYFEELV